MDVTAPLHTVAEVRQLIRFLDLQGTFHFPTLSNGLFSASTASHADFAATGYQSVWVRDTVQIAHAQYVLGNRLMAARAMAALLTFMHRQQQRLVDLIQGRSDPQDAMSRPHIRFDGAKLSSLDESWSHTQNDAIGYLLWLAARLIHEEALVPSRDDLQVIADLVHVLLTVEYWHDEDSGHWEEARKIEASSIGAAVAGLRAVRRLAQDPECARTFSTLPRHIALPLLDDLIAKGETALEEILPAECIQPDPGKRRDVDSALLFLIYPLQVTDGPVAQTIVDNVRAELMGEHGIRRYRGDSYWCGDYRTKLAPETRTVDVSTDMSSRDALLKPGEEAQWCLFDPILSIIFGRWYLQSGDPRRLAEQRVHLRRSLSQLTPPDSPFGPYRCPESYFLERGRYVPNDITPLLWTQANLRLALAQMEASLSAD